MKQLKNAASCIPLIAHPKVFIRLFLFSCKAEVLINVHKCCSLIMGQEIKLLNPFKYLG